MISPQNGSTLGFPRGYVDYGIIVTRFDADVNIQILGAFLPDRLLQMETIDKFQKLDYNMVVYGGSNLRV